MRVSPIAPWWVLVRMVVLLVVVFVVAIGVGVWSQWRPDRPSWEQGTKAPLVSAVVFALGYPVLVRLFIPLPRYQYIEINPLGLVWRDRIGDGALAWADIDVVIVASASTRASAPPLGSGRRRAVLWIQCRNRSVEALPCRRGYPGARWYARCVARRIARAAPWPAQVQVRM